MVMATQTYVTEMQAINPSSVQQVQTNQGPSQQQQNQQGTTVVTVTAPQQSGQTKNNTVTQAATQATIIQPQAGGQQFIVTIAEPAGEQQNQDTIQLQQGTGQVVYPAHAQYVDGADPPIYAASNGQMQTYSDYGQSTMYTPVSTYYQNAGGTQMTTGLAQMSGLQGQILTHQGGTYLVQGGAMDGEGHPLTHTTRASPATVTNTNGPRTANFDAKCWQREDVQQQMFRLQPTSAQQEWTVQWLIDNYETAEGVSLPRSTLYNHYLRHCQEQKMDPMNPASFGKLIRSVFLGLRTRRLGTRGNSKYHYYGIRIKASSTLNQFTDDQTMAMRQTPGNQGKRFKPGPVRGDGSDSQDGSQSSQQSEPANTQQHQHQQFLGDASGAIPNFGMIDLAGVPFPDGVGADHLRIFEQLYKEHCEAILDVVVNLQFSYIEALWQSFWRNLAPENQQSGTNEEARLPKDKLYAMCRLEAVQQYVRQSDYAFYQALVEVLIPDVLRPIPSSLTQAIRNFAKSLEGWLKSSMAGVPEEMMKTKVGSVSAFAQTLRRYTSLNHLAQAARAVLQNTSQINQMLQDLNRVDFANVQEQASWVCQCDDTVVHQLEQDFKKTLQQQNSLEEWAQWLESVVNQVLKPHEGSPNFPKAARQFLLKWSFYSSMVIRDLTLRSAASFGSFHLIRLLYDEYMFYLVEHKVATATGETPIAVMGEFIDLGNVLSMGSMDSEAESEENMKLSPVTLKSNNSQTSAGAITVNHTPLTAVSANGTMTINAASLINTASTTSTFTMLASANATQGPTKTIVVVPVSATPGSAGDGQPAAKKIKTLSNLV